MFVISIYVFELSEVAYYVSNFVMILCFLNIKTKPKEVNRLVGVIEVIVMIVLMDFRHFLDVKITLI